MYFLLRAAAGIALRWYYRDIRFEGVDRIPRGRPLLLAVNHPNALVDALLVCRAVPWRVLILAKATLFRNRLASVLLRSIGVLPVRRATDERARGRVDPSRNRDTFLAVRDALRRGKTILIFPEGKSHDAPSMAPLKTGAARIALEARDAGVHGLLVVPIGLTFERKELPRTRVLVQVGEPLWMDTWRSRQASSRDVEALTAEIDSRLRAVTLNYASADEAARTIRLASAIAALFSETRGPSAERGLDVDAAIARRIGELPALPNEADPLRARAAALVRRLESLEETAALHAISIESAGAGSEPGASLRFAAREGSLMLIAGPLALWGRLNHWLPFRVARMLALRSPSDASDPAMRTLVAGSAFVLIAYGSQTAVVAALLGPLTSIAYLASLPIAADVDFWLRDRMPRIVGRARALASFRRNPALHQRLLKEAAELRSEVLALDRELRDRTMATED